eukprot:2462333-Prymnesium_polylepis.3
MFHSRSASGATIPLREASERAWTPRCASQREVSKPRAPVPPVTTWYPLTLGVRDATLTTILPRLKPL